MLPQSNKQNKKKEKLHLQLLWNGPERQRVYSSHQNTFIWMVLNIIIRYLKALYIRGWIFREIETQQFTEWANTHHLPQLRGVYRKKKKKSETVKQRGEEGGREKKRGGIKWSSFMVPKPALLMLRFATPLNYFGAPSSAAPHTLNQRYMK